MPRHLGEFSMRLSIGLAIAALCMGALAAVAIKIAIVPDDDQALLRVDREAFASALSSINQNNDLLDPNFSWTDSQGKTLSKSDITRALRSGKGLPLEAGNRRGENKIIIAAIGVRTYGNVGVVQANDGKLYVLRIWVRRNAGWQLLIYQAVSTGAPPTAEPGQEDCQNPCTTVPFQPENDDQRQVLRAYQAVERAVAAHDSAAWGAHIADEFFAVTSNSNRPLDKAARMAGLNNQKVAGIAPFPLLSARMFEFGKAMVMISLQQPERGLPLHVTRVWFKRNGEWLEAYSYQTTVQAVDPAR